METTSTTPVGTTTTAQTTSNNTATSTATISSDFETFLRMLTVQVENQDPLDPVDSNDYATQLATFSSVEQQVLTNDLLTGISDQMGLESLQQASGWIGMEALARAPVRFDGDPITVRPEILPDADRADLVVRDESDTIIRRITLDLDADSVTWDGLNDDGTAAAPGNYRFEVESYEDQILMDSQLALAFNRIEEVRREGSITLVRLSDGSELDAGQIDGLRAAPT